MTKMLKVVTNLFAGESGNEMHARGTLGNAAGRPHAATTMLTDIGNDWRCWRLACEPDRSFAWRLGLHLQCLIIALEQDIERVLAEEKQLQLGRSDDE